MLGGNAIQLYVWSNSHTHVFCVFLIVDLFKMHVRPDFSEFLAFWRRGARRAFHASLDTGRRLERYFSKLKISKNVAWYRRTDDCRTIVFLDIALARFLGPHRKGYLLPHKVAFASIVLFKI
jgi:hypothetical protein